MVEIIQFRAGRARKLFAEVNPIIVEMMAVLAHLRKTGVITVHDTEMFRDSFRDIIRANMKTVAEQDTDFEFPQVIPMPDDGIDDE